MRNPDRLKKALKDLCGQAHLYSLKILAEPEDVAACLLEACAGVLKEANKHAGDSPRPLLQIRLDQALEGLGQRPTSAHDAVILDGIRQHQVEVRRRLDQRIAEIKAELNAARPRPRRNGHGRSSVQQYAARLADALRHRDTTDPSPENRLADDYERRHAEILCRLQAGLSRFKEHEEATLESVRRYSPTRREQFIVDRRREILDELDLVERERADERAAIIADGGDAGELAWLDKFCDIARRDLLDSLRRVEALA